MHEAVISVVARPGSRALELHRGSSASPSWSLLKAEDVDATFVSALQVRWAVFVEEQHCDGANELDDDDALSMHFVFFQQEKAVATLRIVPWQHHGSSSSCEAPDYAASLVWNGCEPYVKLGRVATLRENRGSGLAEYLIRRALQYAQSHPCEMVCESDDWEGLVCAHAQIHVVSWYLRLGFELDKGMGTWIEEGIQHQAVWKRCPVASTTQAV